MFTNIIMFFQQPNLSEKNSWRFEVGGLKLDLTPQITLIITSNFKHQTSNFKPFVHPHLRLPVAASDTSYNKRPSVAGDHCASLLLRSFLPPAQ